MKKRNTAKVIEEKLDINSLREFDRRFLLCNLRFSTVDENGLDRDEDQEMVARIAGKDDLFEDVITAFTHEIMRRCSAEGILTIPTYQINKFILFKKSDEGRVSAIADRVMYDFLRGFSFSIKINKNDYNKNAGRVPK